MTEADEYRQFANDCIVWARIATSDNQRARLVELAKQWEAGAKELERAKVSEMGGQEIDRLGDVGNRRRTATPQAEAYRGTARVPGYSHNRAKVAVQTEGDIDLTPRGRHGAETRKT
jgi:hypothetical protein